MGEVDEECVPPSEGLDWEKLFKMAEDPDIEDILRGPLETAIFHLEDGKEVQKLAAIRSLPDLLEREGQECLEKLLPAIQELLKKEKSNLDIHCEAAIVFKGVLQNEKLCNRFPCLIDTLLDSILQNMTSQKDNLSAAAWLETLVEIADRVSLISLKQYIVPVVQQQAEPVQRVQRRIIATKLLHKLADILPPNEVRKELGPCAQMLCQDTNANVRTSMAQRLPTIAKALKNASDTVSLLLPCFIQLCKDEDNTVKETCMNNIAQCIPFLTKDAKKTTIIPLIKKSTEQSLEKKDDILVVIAKNLGEWSYSLRDVLDQLDMCWVLNSYCKIVSLSQTTGENSSAQSMLTLCRRMSAFNFPCMVQLFPKSFDRLLPFLETFCTDTDDEVRMAMASSFHEVLSVHSDRSNLIPAFIELIRGGALEVVAKVTFNLDKILPILYKCAGANTGNGKITTIQLDRILIGCNQLLRGTGAWRSHEAFLKNISVLKGCLTFNHLNDTFVPLLQKEVLQARAIPCRIAAANTLLQFMREQPDKEKREDIINFFKLEIATHLCCYRRSLFLDVVDCVLRMFSRKFFVHYFLSDTINMTQDKISNIRIKAIRLLPRLKSHLILPEDNERLLELERAVRDALTNEKETTTRQLLQKAACELSRCETRCKGNKEDIERTREEEKLWSEERLREIQEVNQLAEKISNEKPSGLKPPELTRTPSPWRTQRRAVAIVRPQPVVVMRSASPAPKQNEGGRPSRLPLIMNNRDKETLKKFSETSALPRPYSRSSSLSSRGSMSTSTSSIETSNGIPTHGYSLRRSATTTSGFGISSTTHSAYPLMTSRSSSSIRRPAYSLTRVSSQSTLERKPSHLSMNIRSTDN